MVCNITKHHLAWNKEYAIVKNYQLNDLKQCSSLEKGSPLVEAGWVLSYITSIKIYEKKLSSSQGDMLKKAHWILIFINFIVSLLLNKYQQVRNIQWHVIKLNTGRLNSILYCKTTNNNYKLMKFIE